MNVIWLIIKGMIMGIGNIIPGVSGGTMAVSLGIYDDLIYSITHLVKKTKKSLKFLFPIGIGLALGVIFFSYMIEYLLGNHAFITSFAFIGLILGGLPTLHQEFQTAFEKQKESFSFKHGAALIFFFLIVLGFSFLQEPAQSGGSLEITIGSMVILFVVGIITAATMIIPGVSGSLVLMILGYYARILQLVNSFIASTLALDWENMLNQFMLLVPFGLGVLFGIFLVSKLVEYLFVKFPSVTYSGILGLVYASPFAILSNINAFEDLMQSNTLPTLLIGLFLLAISFILIYQLSKVEEEVSDY